MNYHYDPELAAAAAAAPLFDVSDAASARGVLAALGALTAPFSFTETVAKSSDVVQGRNGLMVEVQIVRPRVRAPLAPAILWFHGGGFVFGDGSMDFALNTRIAEQTGAVVVSVEYSLAPENPYPAAIDEGYAVLEWMHSRASELGIDTARVAVGGHSAGGCLAASIALMARDRSGPPLCFQVLDLPVTDDRLDTPSMRLFTDTPVWSRSNAAAGWHAYLGDSDGGTLAYAAPARIADLSGLPPAYVSVAEFDPLRDEGMQYAQRLVQAGVSTELHLFPGTFHGSVAATPDAAVTKSMLDNLVGALQRGFSETSCTDVAADLVEVSGS